MPKRLQIPSDGRLRDSWGRENRRLPDRRCIECGAVFRPVRQSSAYCSRPCARKKNGGWNRKPETWWLNQRGYIEGRVWISDTIQICVKQHRWIMEQHLGRPLSATEDVHHKNGNTQDNHIDNLTVLDHGAHSTHTNTERVYRTGYRLNLTGAERQRRSERMKILRRKAIATATDAP